MTTRSTDPFETFREEAMELLSDFETAIVGLEADPADHDLLDSAFRSLHTIKGSGDMFALSDLVALAHAMETVYSRIRDGGMVLDRGVADLSLKGKDLIPALISRGEVAREVLEEAGALREAFRRLAPEADGRDDSSQGPGAAPAAATDPAAGGTRRTYRVRFVPHRDFAVTGANPLPLIEEISSLGETIVLGSAEAVPPLESYDPSAIYLKWDFILSTTADENAVRDVFIFVDDKADIDIRLVDDGGASDVDIDYKRLGDILVERGVVDRSTLDAAAGSREYLGDALVKLGYVGSDEVKSALEEQKFVRKVRESRVGHEAAASIKVRVDKLDRLVNLVGELVTLHAHLAVLADRKHDRDVAGVAEQLEGLVRDVRDLSMEIHMVPVDLLFSGFRRLVRDLSEELGKSVRLILEGTETELDKNVIDALKDPLLHIIRNSIDHGIEPPEDRRRAGKPPEGTIRLSAFYEGAQVVIEVADDGRGMDTGRIKAKAVERGLVAADAPLSDRETLDLIFQAGFSTTDHATSVSGRGVGMDVVRRNVERLNGSIRIENRPGLGTTLRLRIPLTVAIVDGLLARVGDGLFLINLSYIIECLSFSELPSGGDRRMIDFRGEVVPYFDLREFFDSDGEAPQDRQMVVVAVEDRKVGLVVDGVLDNYQTVVKPLGKVYEQAEGVSGAILMGDGTPALMLDIDRLVRVTRMESRGNRGAVSERAVGGP